LISPSVEEMGLASKRVSENSAYQEVPRNSIITDKAKLSASEIDQLFKPEGLTTILINSSRNDPSEIEKDKCLFDGISDVSIDQKDEGGNFNII
jgi:hypothetical protein